jgi:two-component system cell cycle sensor histidine kinase/response regulator CckA
MGIEDADPAAEREFDLASRWAAIVESSADAIIGWTLDGITTSWNAGAEHMYGYAASEMIGRSVFVLVPPGEAPIQVVQDQLQRGERIAFHETKARRKDGSVIDVSLSISPIRDSGGALAGVSSVARDMTELNRAEADRRLLEQQLQEAERLETLGRLAGGVAHDFNNLLAVITSYAGFVADETAEPSVRADAEQIQLAAQRAEALDLNVVIADLRRLLSTSIGEHVDLLITPVTRPAVISADRGQLGQVLLNLAVNARDAMPEGGTLTIGTSLAEFDQRSARRHSGVSPGRYVELTVCDTGAGMSAEIAARIFEPFFTTKPLGQGTGLGLSTVHGIVSQAGGSVNVQSVEGAGSTFQLYFPAASAAGTDPASPEDAARGLGHQAAILVVDDEPAVLEVTSRILRKNGYAVIEAGTYEKALAVASSQDFQLLLTDSLMPGMSGATLADRVTELKPGLPVLHMSGYCSGVLSPQRIRDGDLAFVQKPFSAQALLDKVRVALDAPPAA